jgi:D-sedoheptulose 7-phosphate isomerase
MNKMLEELIADYFSQGQKILAAISPTEVSHLAAAIEKVRVAGKTVYIAGNGGSASTASHFATDIGIGSLRRANPVRVVSLCDNTAVMTAISNDISYDAVFEQQLRLLAQPGDLLVVISASGNSGNLVSVVNAAKEMGVSAYSLTGFDGGKLKAMTPGTNVHVQTEHGAYGLVEDAHLAICHVITECVRS